MGILARFLELIYPPRCAGCNAFLASAPGPVKDGFCAACRAELRVLGDAFCSRCGTPFNIADGEEHICEQCLRKPPWFDSLRAPYAYEGLLMECIQHFKYDGRTHLAEPLGSLLAGFSADLLAAGQDAWLVMPVPLHPRKLRQRGFNQSLLLARPVARRLAAQLDYLALRRVRFTESQTGLNRRQRKANVRGAFRLLRPAAVKGRKLLLVDDVVTTGSTMNECARTLKQAGAAEVLCLGLARRL